MICEMCGKEDIATKPMMVEGTRLSLCPNCARFGDEYKASSGSAPQGSPVTKTVIEERLQKRERRMGTRDVYAGAATLELIDDYGKVIREAREAKGMDLEEFGKLILEKKGILAKVEAHDLIPDDKLINKLEKALNIKLRELVQPGAQVGQSGRRQEAFTLNDFIKKK
ncbi:MAG: multiprotein bridging factor aMBF1 [Candidatus Methanoplasma sp.]|nr:multiprotein bridging factor aMBF1 [Candidatus Methanoplasma sp.]